MKEAPFPWNKEPSRFAATIGEWLVLIFFVAPLMTVGALLIAALGILDRHPMARLNLALLLILAGGFVLA